ncbi:putative protein phosphatase 2C 2 [Raphanus sativus]|nr:putative protein phosphatase 2C 2 [Raphanus sativus]
MQLAGFLPEALFSFLQQQGVAASNPNSVSFPSPSSGFLSFRCVSHFALLHPSTYTAVIETQLLLHDSQAIFGVYDGHGGSRASEFAAENLCNNILREIGSEGNESEIEEAVKRGYLATDSEFLKEKDVKGGSCCVTALIKDGNLVVSSAGDCRAVLSVGGLAEALTSDHRPSREDERNRIERSGGYVDTFNSVWRIQGSLAVSRGIGDAHLKRWVISEPETKILHINPQHEFLILASDGLWEKVGNQEAVDIARSFCMGTDQNQKLLLACKKLVDLSVSRGSFDDISVMLIPLCRFI